MRGAGWWKYTSGLPFTNETRHKLRRLADKEYIDNVVIQGGDPLAPRNLADTLKLCKQLRDDLPTKRIVIFTGYTLLEIQSDTELKKILKHIDILVDGRYDRSRPKAKWRGSDNQRIYEIVDGEVAGEHKDS